MTGILFAFSPELTAPLNLKSPVNAGMALMWGSIGLTLGDVGIGLLSQFLGSRKRALVIALILAAATSLVYLNSFGATSQWIYFLCFVIGIFIGYWAVLVTTAAEQFGTNLRATVATTVPNFVRGSAVICTTAFASLKDHIGIVESAIAIGTICFFLAIVSALTLNETFSKDLDFIEK